MSAPAPAQAPTRRGFCCGAAASLVCCLPGLRAQAQVLRGGEIALEPVAEGIYVSRGQHAEMLAENLGAIANVGFVVGERSVAVIDSGGCRAWGLRLRAAIRSVTDRPISHVILTHVHPDHVFGSAAFLADNPVFVGHAKLPRALAHRGPFYLERLTEALGDLAEGTQVVQPTELVKDRLEIDLGGRSLTVTAHPTAHTDNDLSLLDSATGTLWLSDLLFMERTPVLDGSLLGWLEVMAGLKAQAAARVVPGHGPVSAPWPDALGHQERYLLTLRDEIRQIIAEGGTMEQAVESVGQGEGDRWQLFADYNPRNVIAAFAELEWE